MEPVSPERCSTNYEEAALGLRKMLAPVEQEEGGDGEDAMEATGAPSEGKKEEKEKGQQKKKPLIQMPSRNQSVRTSEDWKKAKKAAAQSDKRSH